MDTPRILEVWASTEAFVIQRRNWRYNRTINKNLEVIMRECVRCNIAMVENCGIKVKGAAYGLVLTDDENKWWGGRMEQPKVAICPKCGEVSIYLENVEKLRNK